MEEWKECTIGDICESVSETYSRKDEKVVLINTSDVLEGKFFTHATTKNENLKGQFKKTFQKSDILYSEIRPANRRYAFVDFEKTENYIASTKLMVIRPNQELVLPRFLYLLLTSSDLISEMQHLAETRSGTFPQITFSGELATFPIKLPPLPTQQKIAAILSSLDNKIELNNKINTNLEQQAQALFKNWFVDFEPFDGKMPEGWKVGKLEDIADYYNGYAFSSKELLNEPEENCLDVFKQGHIKKGGGFISDGTKSWYPLSKCEKLKNFILKKGDILMAMTDMKGNVAILGNTAIMPVDDKYIVNQRVGLLRAKENLNIDYPYLYLLTNDHDFLMDLRSRANSGVQVNLSSTAIKESEVNIAPKEVYKQFNDIILPLFEKILANQQENQKLANIRDTLLPKLMNGEIEV